MVRSVGQRTRCSGPPWIVIDTSKMACVYTAEAVSHLFIARRTVIDPPHLPLPVFRLMKLNTTEITCRQNAQPIGQWL